MNWYFFLIGIFLIIVGVIMMSKEIKRFLGDIRASNSTGLTIIKRALDLVLFGGTGLFGLFLSLIGVAFLGSFFNFWN